MKSVTINTDAGFLPDQKVGAYAYWIKAEGLFLRGSGIFKDKCRDPNDAETRAIVNALYILLASKYKAEKIIINRDNYNAIPNENGSDSQKKMAIIIDLLKKYSIPATHKNYAKEGKRGYVEFRHVKAHLHTHTPRHWVNDWCDKRCKKELATWKLENNDT